MIAIEYTPSDYGKIMEYITCIEKKASMIKDLLEDNTVNLRKRRYDEDDDDNYRTHKITRFS